MEKCDDSADASQPAADVLESDSDVKDKNDSRKYCRNNTLLEEFLTGRRLNVGGFCHLETVICIFLFKSVIEDDLLVSSQTRI